MARKKLARSGKQKNDSIQKGSTAVIILIVILIFLILIALGLFFIWRMFFASNGYPTPREFTSQYSTPVRPDETAVKGNVDPSLVGTWESNCLVPDLDSPWSEKHQFIINADGAAKHTRWSSGGHACSPETTMVDKYTVSTPSTGQIHFTLIEGVGPGEDIYQVTGDTLLFGHGFRNNFPYTENTLNKYIVYKKKS